MNLQEAANEISRLRDHIATKPPTKAGRRMFEAIQTVLREIERLRKDLRHQAPVAKVGQTMMNMLEGMTAPEIREGEDPVDGYIRVYERQKAEIECLRACHETELGECEQHCDVVKQLRVELLDTQNAIRLILGREQNVRWAEISADDVESHVAFIRGQRGTLVRQEMSDEES